MTLFELRDQVSNAHSRISKIENEINLIKSNIDLDHQSINSNFSKIKDKINLDKSHNDFSIQVFESRISRLENEINSNRSFNTSELAKLSDKSIKKCIVYGFFTGIGLGIVISIFSLVLYFLIG